MENDLGILSIPYSKITDFVDKLVRYYETNDSTELKTFLKEDCLTLINEKNQERKRKTRTNKTRTKCSRYEDD